MKLHALLAFVAILISTQIGDRNSDTFRILGARPVPARDLTFKNGSAVSCGTATTQNERWLGSISVSRVMSHGVARDDNLARINPDSSISDLELGTVIPYGNVLVRLESGDGTGITARRVRSMEYDHLSRELADGVIVYFGGVFSVGDHDTLRLESMDIDIKSGKGVFSGKVQHREGPFGKLDPDRTVRLVDARAGDVFQVADVKFKVLSVVLPDAQLRTIGWVVLDVVQPAE